MIKQAISGVEDMERSFDLVYDKLESFSKTKSGQNILIEDQDIDEDVDKLKSHLYQINDELRKFNREIQN